MNQIFEEFRTRLLHQSNCFLLFCQHRVHGINKNEGLLTKTNQAQKLCSPFRWGILSLKVLPLAVVSTFRQFCSTSCSALLSTRTVKEEASRRSADQLNEPAKLSLLSLLLRKSGPLLGYATQNQLSERRNFREAKVYGYPCALLLRKSEAFGNSSVPRVRARRGFYPYTFACSAKLSTRKCTVTRAHFCFAKVRPSVTRATLEFEQKGGHFCEAKVTESYSAVCSARLAERKSLLCASMRSSASFEPKKVKREPKYSNRVGFTTFLGNTGIKWDAGTEEPALLNPPSGDSRNSVPAIASATQKQGRRSRHFGSKGTQGGGSENARLPRAQPTAEQEESKSCRNGATPAVGYRVATRVELLPNSFGTQHGQALTEQLKVGFGLSSTALCNNATNTKYKIIRPLLNLSRETLTILCKDLQLPVYPDKSNKAVQYSRNRLREQILPAIKLFLNPKIDHALFKLAELLTQDFSLVSNLVNTGRRSNSPLVRAHPSGEQGLPGT